MHKRRLNELKLHLVIEPAGPVLVKSGVESGADPTLPAMNFVRTQHPRTGERTIYLPGSSLKGVIRSHSERILRTVFGDDPAACCDPLSRNNSCAARLAGIGESDTARQYKQLCLTCRVFGHMAQASHFLITDAYPQTAIQTLPVRQNVAIDRLSGGVAVGPFDMEVAMEGRFHTSITLFNFELWQVGLLALALRDLSEGRVRLGFAKSRGLGEVRAYYTQLAVAYPGQFGTNGQPFERRLFGVGALARDLVEDYGYVAQDELEYSRPGHWVEDSAAWGRPEIRFGAGDSNVISLSDDEMQDAHREVVAVLSRAAQAWVDYAAQWQADSG